MEGKDDKSPLLYYTAIKPRFFYVLQQFSNRFWIIMTLLGAILVATIIGLSVHSSANDETKELKLLHVVSFGVAKPGWCAGKVF